MQQEKVAKKIKLNSDEILNYAFASLERFQRNYTNSRPLL